MFRPTAFLDKVLNVACVCLSLMSSVLSPTMIAMTGMFLVNSASVKNAPITEPDLMFHMVRYSICVLLRTAVYLYTEQTISITKYIFYLNVLQLLYYLLI